MKDFLVTYNLIHTNGGGSTPGYSIVVKAQDSTEAKLMVKREIPRATFIIAQEIKP